MTTETTFTGTTPVAHWYRHLLELKRPQRGLSEDDRAVRNDAIFQATSALMHQPAETLADIDLKLAALCARLRSEDYSPTSPNAPSASASALFRTGSAATAGPKVPRACC